MFPRVAERREYEDIHPRDRYSRRGDRADRRYHYEEEEFEYSPPRRHPTRVREVEKEIIEPRKIPVELTKGYHSRDSSVGPMPVPAHVSDEYAYLPKELHRDRGRDQLQLVRPKRGRRSPPEEVVVDKYSRHGRSRTRDHERDWEVDIERERRHVEDRHVIAPPRRARSRPRDIEREEVIIRHDDSPGRRGVERDEIIIRREMNDSPASEASFGPEPLPQYAAPIHQDYITHHKHVDHGYIVVPKEKVVEPRRPSIEEIDIRRRRDRDLRDDIEIVHRREHESRPQRRDHMPLPIRGREAVRDSRDLEDIEAEAEFYNRHATDRSRMGEGYHGATRDWNILDVPPGTKRVTMDGAGGGSQEVSWQKYNGVRRSKFNPDGIEHGRGREYGRDHGSVGKSYVGIKDKRDEMWTEITKDLIVKEALDWAGYDYEETAYFFYIFAYLEFNDVAELVDVSKDYRHGRRNRIREMQRERARIVPLPSY